MSEQTVPANWRDMFRVWLRIGLLSFGGPAGQIALMHREIVDDRQWISEQDYLNALSFCMVLPGPEAMQLATYVGWKLHGVRGGLLAGLLFIIPGALLVLALAIFYAFYGSVTVVAALFLGVKAAVVVIVIEALLKVARRALKRRDHWLIAALAFAGIFLLNLPFPLLVALAALYGYLSARAVPVDATPAAPAVGLGRSLRTIILWLAIWWLPLAALALVMPGSILISIGLFFSKLAVVTFGGAYAVLGYIAQAVVTEKHWLEPGQMIDGLGLAETTPGPLILVTEFVGYLAAFGAGGLWLGMAGAVVTLWMTFAPCFLWIFAGAPFIDGLPRQPRIQNALAAVVAAVVGVILNLTLWFALHVLFANVAQKRAGWLVLWQPQWGTIDWIALGLTALAALLLLRLKLGLGRVLMVMAVAGLILGVMS